MPGKRRPSRRTGEAVTGTAAGVPFTALPPEGVVEGPVPLVAVWHMMDAPCTDAACAAALPMARLAAWRVYLGMPMTGRRSVPAGRDGGGDGGGPTGPGADGGAGDDGDDGAGDGGDGGKGDGGDGGDALLRLAERDIVLAYLAPIVRRAAAEFPAALAALRARLPGAGGPLGLAGGSLGGAVVLRLLARGGLPVAAAALVNPAVRARSVVAVMEDPAEPYRWHRAASRVAAELDFVARAGDVAARSPQPPLLLVSGARDHPPLRADAAALVSALRSRYADPDDARLVEAAGLEHPVAARPGVEPAPQTPGARAVDAAFTDWFARHLPGRPGPDPYGG